MTIGIYRIRNVVNDKNYIGSSINNVHVRLNYHISSLTRQKHRNPHLQASWNKYGKDAFELTVIEECDKEIMLVREDYWMNYYDSRNPSKGYNLRTAERHECAEATKKKISEALTGKKQSAETIRKRADKLIGHKGWNEGVATPEEVKKKIAESMLGSKNHFYGKLHSEETKAKMRSRVMSEEAKLKMIATRKLNQLNRSQIRQDSYQTKTSSLPLS